MITCGNKDNKSVTVIQRKPLVLKPGAVIDSLDNVKVYYNGLVLNTMGRHLGPDGYNYGLKYQCVEFVKRYYHDHYKHFMPDTYGNAKDFFNKWVPDGGQNKQRDLLQFTNPSVSRPKKGDLLVFDETTSNEFGHVAIVSNVEETEIEIIQQNPGPLAKSRVTIPLFMAGKKYCLAQSEILGWLRKN